MLSERTLRGRCDLQGFGTDSEAPHQAAIEALTEALEDAYQEQRDEAPEDRRWTEGTMQTLSDSLELLSELRDGIARIHRPGDEAPE